MARQSKEDKRAHDTISRIYITIGKGIEINVMDISKVYQVGKDALRDGATEEQLTERLRAYLETIRKN